MAERYKQLIKTGMQYQSDCPILLAASALLLDTQTQYVFAQLKLESVVSKTISAVFVALECFDPAGTVTLCREEYWFRDLKAKFSDQFGQKTAIPITQDAVRSFTVHIKTIVFSTGDSWNASDPKQIMQILPEKEPINSLLGTKLADQYNRECNKLIGRNPANVPQRYDNLVYCACGATYHNIEKTCPICQIELKEFELRINKAYLEKRFAEYHKAQQIAAAEEQRIEDERKAESDKRKRRMLKIIIPIFMGIIFTVLLIKIFIPAKYYRNGEALLAEGDFEGAQSEFIMAGDYRDASNRILEVYYLQAESFLADGNNEEADAAFRLAMNYEDASERIGEGYYKLAEELLASGKFEAADATFRLAMNYKDASERIGEGYYKLADDLLASGEFEAANEAFVSAGDYQDASERIFETYYKQGQNAKIEGNNVEAIEAFINAGSYRDSKTQVAMLVAEDVKAAIYFAQIGDTVLFGAYEQDNIATNGKEAIEWFVLDKTDSSCLLISKYCLDRQPYNSSNSDNVTWGKSSLRKWLNSTFIDSAFSNDEKECILDSSIVSGTYNASPENTVDKVFLLSHEEAERYFSSDNLRATYPTAYAKSHGVYVESGNSPWYLRSIVDYESARVIDTDGSTDDATGYFNSPQVGIRPSIWISFE